MRIKKAWQKKVYFLICSIMVGVILSGVCVHNAPFVFANENPSWVEPNHINLQRIGASTSEQQEPSFLNNIDCLPAPYRLSNDKNMRVGCFTNTAYGSFDSGTNTVIFNGTDEGLPLIPYSAHEIFAPWPQAEDLIVFTASSTGGSGMSIYKNPLSKIRDQRDVFGQLKAKQFIAPPDLQLKDQENRPLIVNPQTLAFSDDGSWLSVETIYGSFIRMDLGSLNAVPYAPSFNTPGGSSPQDAETAVSDDGRYMAVGDGLAPSLKVYDLSACTTQRGVSICPSHEYWNFLAQKIPGLHTLKHLRFMNEDTLSFQTTETDPAGSSLYELKANDPSPYLVEYLGLGDSYTSGEGAFDYLVGTDTSHNKCHMSIHSYPLLLTNNLYNNTAGHSVACSGAVINDILSSSSHYRGQVKNGMTLGELEQAPGSPISMIMANYSPGYVPQSKFVKKYQPNVVTVSIGGNDIGFGDILQNCVEPHISLHKDPNTCYGSFEARVEVTNLVDRTISRWSNLYRQIHAESPKTTIYAIGYPNVVYPSGKCAINVQLNRSELEFSEELVQYINHAISQAASAAGINYVDIYHALDGHRLCEGNDGDVAVNGLTAGKDPGSDISVLGRESYHPNALGQALIEQAVLHQTDNFRMGGNQSGAALNPILQVPKSGEPIDTLVSDSKLTDTHVFHANDPINIYAAGMQDGLKADEKYTVRVDGVGGKQLASLYSDQNGEIHGDVIIPDNEIPGGHTIDIVGTNQLGETTDVRESIYITATITDADGDGIPDAVDSCTYAINSRQDLDDDNVDDICDSQIDKPLEPKAKASQKRLGVGNSVPERNNFISRTSVHDSGVTGPKSQPIPLTTHARVLHVVNIAKQTHPPSRRAQLYDPMSFLTMYRLWLRIECRILLALFIR